MIFSRKKDFRISERFYPKHDAYVVFSPGFMKRGSIINISRGGLACLYTIERGVKEVSFDRYINIKCGSSKIGELSFKIISDFVISGNQYEGQRTIRKRSILFCDLSAIQKTQINQFIDAHTKLSAAEYNKKMF